MAYLNKQELLNLGFKHLGENVLISDKAAIYNANVIEIGDNTRVDDFCILSGKISIGSYCHITPMCLIAGGELGVFLSDFCTLAYGVKIFSQSDDYSGDTLVNSLIPKKFKNATFAAVFLEKHVVIGAGATILPGVTLAEGTSIGAMSLVMENTLPWKIYIGIPAKILKDRSNKLLELEKQFLEIDNGSI